jgi:hypothetical protein
MRRLIGFEEVKFDSCIYPYTLEDELLPKGEVMLRLWYTWPLATSLSLASSVFKSLRPLTFFLL